MREADPSIHPERNLWCEVLLRAVDDALHGPQVNDGTSRLRVISEARSYLTTPSKDLSLVCSLAGVDMEALIDRMKRQLATAPTPEELIAGQKVSRVTITKREKPATKKRTVQTYTHNGITDTVAGWSERTGIAKAVIANRLANGWDVADALTLTTNEARHRARQTMRTRINTEVTRQGKSWKRGSPERLITHNGETMTIAQWADRTGLKVSTIKNRLRKGWTIAQALDPTDHRRKEAA